MITEFQQHIYNTHLKISRTSQDKPYKRRKDFSKFDEDKAIILNRLEIFFNNHNSVNIEDYFLAPYKLFDDCEYYPLDFYTSIKSMKYYRDYMAKLEIMSPDTDDALLRLRDSLKFIKEFCSEKGLTLESYVGYSEGVTPMVLTHLKEHNINFYALHALKLTNIGVESDILDIAFSNFWKVFQTTRTKYLTSKRMKKLGEKALIKIKEDL